MVQSSGLTTFWIQPKIQRADDRIRWRRKNKLLKVSGWLGNRRRARLLSEHLVDKSSRKVHIVLSDVFRPKEISLHVLLLYTLIFVR
jgi:hypothetical protein